MNPKQLKRLFPVLALPMILSSGVLKADVPNVVSAILWIQEMQDPAELSLGCVKRARPELILIQPIIML